MLTLTPELVRRLDDVGHHRKTLETYLGRRRVVHEGQYQDAERDAITKAALFLSSFQSSMSACPLLVPGLDNVAAFTVGASGQNLVLRDRD